MQQADRPGQLSVQKEDTFCAAAQLVFRSLCWGHLLLLELRGPRAVLAVVVCSVLRGLGGAMVRLLITEQPTMEQTCHSQSQQQHPLPGSPPASGGPPTQTQLYRPRSAVTEALYHLFLDHLQSFLQAYSSIDTQSLEPETPSHTQAEPPQRQAPFLRPESATTMEAFLRCGVHQYGFARLRCEECQFERLVPFSCKRRGLCASCHAKTLVSWCDWLLTEWLPDVPYRQWVFTVPKRLRPLFAYDPNLNKRLSQIIASLLQYWMQTTLGHPMLQPLMIAVDQTFGTLLNFHPHQHWLVSDGAFAPDGSFVLLPRMLPRVREQLTRVLQRKVLGMLVRMGKIPAEERDRMLGWKYTGFSIDTSVRIKEDRREELERLLCYIRRHPFRMWGFSYNPEYGVVLYRAGKMNGLKKRNFVTFNEPIEAIEALSRLIPHGKKHTVRYYGAAHPQVHQWYGLQPGGHPRVVHMPRHLRRLGRRRWARCLWLVYGVDVSTCPDCRRPLRQVAVLQNGAVIAKILEHLGHPGEPLRCSPPRAPPNELPNSPGCQDQQPQMHTSPESWEPDVDFLPPDEWYIIDELP